MSANLDQVTAIETQKLQDELQKQLNSTETAPIGFTGSRDSHWPIH